MIQSLREHHCFCPLSQLGGLKRSVHVRGFLLAHCRGLSPSQHALLVPTGRQPRLRTVIRYHSLPPSLALVDPDTTACPSGCWAAVASFRAWLLKVHTPSNALVRNHVRVHVRVNHLRVIHEITHRTQVQEFQLKNPVLSSQYILVCMFRNEQREPIFMQWKPNEVSYLKAVGHIYTLRSVSACLKCLHLLFVLLSLKWN